MRRLPRSAGFTLIEVLLALMIFGVAIITFVESMGMATRAQGDLADRQRASMLAENILEEMLYSGEFEEGEDSGELGEANAGYTWATQVERDPDHETLFHVRVTIAWDNGRRQSYELATMIARLRQESQPL